MNIVLIWLYRISHEHCVDLAVVILNTVHSANCWWCQNLHNVHQRCPARGKRRLRMPL